MAASPRRARSYGSRARPAAAGRGGTRRRRCSMGAGDSTAGGERRGGGGRGRRWRWRMAASPRASPRGAGVGRRAGSCGGTCGGGGGGRAVLAGERAAVQRAGGVHGGRARLPVQPGLRRRVAHPSPSSPCLFPVFSITHNIAKSNARCSLRPQRQNVSALSPEQCGLQRPGPDFISWREPLHKDSQDSQLLQMRNKASRGCARPARLAGTPAVRSLHSVRIPGAHGIARIGFHHAECAPAPLGFALFPLAPPNPPVPAGLACELVCPSGPVGGAESAVTAPCRCGRRQTRRVDRAPAAARGGLCAPSGDPHGG